MASTLKKPDRLYSLTEEHGRLIVTASPQARAYYVSLGVLFLAIALVVLAVYVFAAQPLSGAQWGLVIFMMLAPMVGVVLLYGFLVRRTHVVFDRVTDRVLLSGNVIGPLGSLDALSIHPVESLDSRRSWIGLTATFQLGRSHVLLKQEAPAEELQALAGTLATRLDVPLQGEDVEERAGTRADRPASPYAWLGAAVGLLFSILFMLPSTMFSTQKANCLDTPVQSPAVPPPHKSLHFIPTSEFPGALTEELVRYYRLKFNLAITVLPAMPLKPAMRDSSRRQYIAERLVAAAQRRHPRQAGDAGAVLIVLTAKDMYIESFTWRYAYAYRTDGRFAVVSTARMDPSFSLWRWLIGDLDEHEEEQKLLTCRLKKMVSKQIGLLYYGFPESSDERSVLYSPIMGPDDLDRIGEDF